MITRDAMTLRAGEGDAVTFEVRGTSYTVQPRGEVIVSLANQGPVIAGRPSLRQFADLRREDGTLLSASVPTVTTAIPVITDPTLVVEPETIVP